MDSPFNLALVPDIPCRGTGRTAERPAYDTNAHRPLSTLIPIERHQTFQCFGALKSEAQTTRKARCRPSTLDKPNACLACTWLIHVKTNLDFMQFLLFHWSFFTRVSASSVAATVLYRLMRFRHRTKQFASRSLAAIVCSIFYVSCVSAQQSSEELAKAAQNPVAAMISVPFQNNTNFNVGPYNRAQDILNIQPVVPVTLNSEWNLISRSIVPLMLQPSPATDSSLFGLGDISETLFLSPAKPGSIIWGIGPAITFPTATNSTLGTGKWLAGPSAVALVTPGHWVIGALISNQWSFAGDGSRPSVNTGLVQPFINYNLPDGWYVTTSPIITVNWNAASGQQWTVPLGGGIGRVFRIGEQPINAQLAGYYNVVRPDGGADWQLRLQLSLLFPRR